MIPNTGLSNYTSVDPKYELKGFNEGFHHACLWWVLGPRKSDFSIFWPWFQKSTKWVPGSAILAFSGLGSRSRQNGSQEIRFHHFLALGPEVDKMSPRRSDFSIFWPTFDALGGGRYRNWAIYRRVATSTCVLIAKNVWFLRFSDRSAQFLTRWAGDDIEIEQFTAEWRHRHPLWPQKMRVFCGFGIIMDNFWRAGRGTI